MPLKIRCPQCQKSLTVPDQMAGRTGTCPGCKASISIPPNLTPPRVEPIVVPAAPFIAQSVADAPASSAKTSRLKSLSGRSWKFWVAAAAVVVAGYYMLSLFGHMTRVVWQSTFPSFADSSASETALSRMGYDRSHCLVCISARSATAHSLYSDDHGYGLCQECGPGHEAMMRMAKNGGRGTPADQQATQFYFQTMQHHLGQNPTDVRRALFMSLLAFDSPEWNSLYGPLSAKPQGVARELTDDDYRSHKLWNDFRKQLGEPDVQPSATKALGLNVEEVRRFGDSDGLLIFRDKVVVGLRYAVSQGDKAIALLLVTVGRKVGPEQCTKVITLLSQAIRTSGQDFALDADNLRCVARRDGPTITVRLSFIDEIEDYRHTGKIRRPFDIQLMPDFMPR